MDQLTERRCLKSLKILLQHARRFPKETHAMMTKMSQCEPVYTDPASAWFLLGMVYGSLGTIMTDDFVLYLKVIEVACKEKDFKPGDFIGPKRLYGRAT